MVFFRTMSRRQVLAGMGAAGAAGTLALACGTRQARDARRASSTPLPAQAGTRETTDQPVSGGTITLAGADIQHFDYQTTFAVIQTFYSNRLLRYKTGSAISPNQYEIIPDLAASWEAPEPRRLIVKLNAARFHDKVPVSGRAVTSEDVKATFDLLNTKKPNYVYRYLVDFIEKIETPAPDTVAFTLAYPTTLIYNALAYYNSAIAPKEIIVRDGNLQKNDIGTGPFVLERYDKGVAFKFSRNPRYFRDGRPYLDGVELSVLADSSARFDAYRAGKLDALDLGHDLLASARKTLGPESTVQIQPGIGWNAFIFNVKKAPWSDLRVRQAFHYALDRTAINQLVTGGLGTIRTGPLARGWANWSRPDSEIARDATRDLARAKQLLAAAGYSDGFDTEWIYGPYGTTDTDTTKVAQVVQEQLKAIGIQMKITIQENLAWLQRLQTHDFALSSWVIRAYPDPDDYLYPFFYPQGAKNFGEVDDQNLTDLILKERQASDVESRKRLLQDIDRRWPIDFGYAVWTIESPFIHVYNNRLRDYSGRNPVEYAGLADVFIRK